MTNKVGILLIVIFGTSFANENALKFFSGEALSAKALRYGVQQTKIHQANTKTNDMASVSELLTTAAKKIAVRLSDRATDTAALANAAKSSDTVDSRCWILASKWRFLSFIFLLSFFYLPD